MGLVAGVSWPILSYTTNLYFMAELSLSNTARGELESIVCVFFMVWLVCVLRRHGLPVRAMGHEFCMTKQEFSKFCRQRLRNIVKIHPSIWMMIQRRVGLAKTHFLSSSTLPCTLIVLYQNYVFSIPKLLELTNRHTWFGKFFILPGLPQFYETLVLHTNLAGKLFSWHRLRLSSWTEASWVTTLGSPTANSQFERFSSSRWARLDKLKNKNTFQIRACLLEKVRLSMFKLLFEAF